MTRIALAVLAMAAGCQPPPEISLGEPSVTVAFPPQNNEEGSGPFEVAADVSGAWSIFMVIDVDNFELVDPYLEENSENRTRQGHWHLEVFGNETPVPGISFINFEVDAEDGEVGDLVTLRALLKNNDHSPYPDANGDPLEASVEVLLAAAP